MCRLSRLFKSGKHRFASYDNPDGPPHEGGLSTDEMRQVAKDEDVSVDWLGLQDGRRLCDNPSNNARPQEIHNVGIGRGLKTKVNVNIGTSTLNIDLDAEIKKAEVAVKYHADTIMDLSDGGDVKMIRRALLDAAPITFGTVPYLRGVQSRNPGSQEPAEPHRRRLSQRV